MSRKSRSRMVDTVQSPVVERVTVSPRFHLRHAIRIALGIMTALRANPLYAELPVPCSTGTCGLGGPNTWVTSGNATHVTAGKAMTVQQNSDRAILNWAGFNISADSSVEFKQPSAKALAINKIFQADPSRILGKLTANGQVYLINQNGIMFGQGAQVNTASLVASTLNITPAAEANGLTGALSINKEAAFTAARDTNGNVISKDVVVEQGATLTSADGGRILLFAPNVTNRGSLTTPNGQAVLGAGTKIYLQTSSNSSLRGLVVEVDVEDVSDTDLQRFLNGELAELPLGKAQNFGSISATTGNISLVGLAVNQAGRVTASTSVLANGTVYLHARDKQDTGGAGLPSGGLIPTRGGKVTLGESSITEVKLNTASTETTVDVNVQPKSGVNLVGHTVQLLRNSTISAKGGRVAITAQANPSVSELALAGTTANTSRVLMESGAKIDVSGATVQLAANSQTLDVELFSEQLKNSPLQRDGVLKGETITVDLRQKGVREDGLAWVGTPLLAGVDGIDDGILRTVAERNVAGGSINIVSQGDVIVAPGSVMDISGGRVDYAAGSIKTTQLRSQGKVIDIADADPSRIYDGIVGEITRKDSKWGITETWRTSESTSTYSAAYSEGRDAGTVAINSPRLILDGAIDGSVTQGINKRLPDAAAKGGTLIVGYQTGANLEPPSLRSDAIRISEQMVLNGLQSSGFDARRDVLPIQIDSITLRPSLFGEQGVAHGVLLSNKDITVPTGSTLNLAAGGSLNLLGERVVIAGQINAPGGSVTAVAGRTVASTPSSVHDVTLASGARIDVSGQWVNDNPALGSDTSTPVWVDGGSVSLRSNEGSVRVEAGASIDASGSAWLQTDGDIKAGRGGSISLSSNKPGVNNRVQLDGEVMAFGLANGGSLSITTNSVCISGGACDSQTTGNELQLSPGFFQQGGFSSYSITSNLGSLIVAGDANIRLRQLNRVLGSSFATQRTGADLETFSRVELLPDYQRKATNLSLVSSGNYPAELRIDTGAVIQADPGATLKLSTSSRMLMDGNLLTPGGSVSLSLLNFGGSPDFIANQALWLGAHASIDVSGTRLLQPNSLGLSVGKVLGGGNITLNANRGYVVAEQGSRLDVSGTAAQLDIQTSDGGYQRRSIGSNAGSISIAAAEGAVLEGQLTGKAGSPTALGGTFSLKLDGNTRGEPNILNLQSNHYPHGSRVIEVIEGEFVGGLNGATYSTLNDSNTAAINGIARINGSKLDAAGFDALTLTARTLMDVDTGEARSTGIVRLNGDLQLGRKLVIDASTLEVVAPEVTLAAPYIALGSTFVRSQAVSTPATGSRSLLVHGDWIDVIGNSSISGASSVHLHSENDLRLRAMPELALSPNARSLTGSLVTSGDLVLQASQLYPATLTDFSVTAVNGANNTLGKITVLPTDAVQTPVLSAGGALHLNAAIIDQQGVIKAPFGSIELNATGTAPGAGQLLLAPGSVTSTSAGGAIIPLGRIEGGLDWTYDLGNQQKLVLSSELDGIPAQRIELSGTDVQLGDGAVINLSASGDMQAYEFVAGVGGSTDILSLAKAGNSYAIVPTLGKNLAPFDHQESADFELSIGTTVHLLDGAMGLVTGEYAVLPARYALLPGAYLISEQSGYQDLSPGARGTLRDGTPVVAGVFGVAGTDQREDRTRAFSIVSSEFLRDAANVHRPAEYRLSLASNFFKAQTLAAGITSTRLPFDAGTLAISATRSLDLQATLQGAAGKGGRGAAVDIASDRMVITPDNATVNGGAIPIEASSLNRLDAESIVLGGLRNTTADGTQLNVVSSEVTIAAGAQLVAPEIILAARNNLSVEAGASVTGRGVTSGGSENYLLNGNSAVLRVSSGPQANLERTGVTGTAGALAVAAGATIAADGAVFVDATADVSFKGNLQLDDGDLAVGASRINLGAVPVNAVGFSLDQAQLAALSQSVDKLLLRSRGDINLYGAPTLNAGEVTLDAGGIVARSGNANAVTVIAADKVTLTNTTGAPESVLPGTSNGRLEITAQDIELADGTYLIGGFNDVALSAQKTLLGRDTGSLKVKATPAEAADLALNAGVIGGHAGATTRIEASGDVNIAWSGTATTLPTDALGVDLSVSGNSIQHGGRIVTEAGKVSLNAVGTGDVTVTSGAVLDASGVSRQFDTKTVFADAGVIALNSAAGDVNVESGAVLDVSGAVVNGAGGAAGDIRASTPQGVIRIDGTVSGQAATAQRQGSVDLDGRAIANLDALNTKLNTAGFTDERVLRIREGDVNLASDVIAKHIDITVDGMNNSGGALTVGGRLNAAGAKGGHVRLAARDDITLAAGAAIDVNASDAKGAGGKVELMSQSGGVQLLAGSSINAAGGAQAENGTVHLRVSRDVLEQFVSNPAGQKMALAGAINGARELIVEGVKTYEQQDGRISSDETAAFSSEAFLDAETFMQSAANITAALGSAGNSSFHVRPGVEMWSTGDLTLDSTWDLYDWRFNGGESGYLTLRAGGDLNINQDLTDGVSAMNFLDQPALESWSYRLAAGANFDGASPFGLKDNATTGSLLLGSNPGSQRAIRTGTGDIEIATARDVRLADQSSVIYTMGVPVKDLSQDVRDLAQFESLITLAERGGDITINAQGDVIGLPTRQLVTDWMWRSGSNRDYDNPSPTMWGSEFSRFQSGIGALAGGDVTVLAGGNIDNVSAATATTGVPLGLTRTDKTLDIRGGGDLRVEAGGDIGGGVYYVGRGTGKLRAGGDIRAGTNWTHQGKALHTTLALGDGQFFLTARGDTAIETIFNPTILSPSAGQGVISDFEWLTDFVTYSDASKVALTSIAGNALFNGNTESLYAYAEDANTLSKGNRANPANRLRILPASLQMVSLSGDVVTGSVDTVGSVEYLTLFPAPNSQLEFLAQGDVLFGLGQSYSISDADPVFFPKPENPERPGNSSNLISSLNNLVRPYGRYAHADTPVHSSEYAAEVGYAGERIPALVVAQTGNINGITLASAKPVKLIAGGNIFDPQLDIQNVEANDVSVVSAGGDITYPLLRNASRNVSTSAKSITVDGPGELIVSAGGDIDLKASPGILSRGNTVNAALIDVGASITAFAGNGASAPDYDAFIQTYLSDRDTYQDQLTKFMEEQGLVGSPGSLLAAFKVLPREQQVPFLARLLFAELRTVGRKAATEGTGDYAAGYAAIKTLFPTIDPEKLHTGDINLFFSRIYTLDGGDINMLIPGGVLNAGLATPPESFGVRKLPSQLGIVAQTTGDVSILTGQDTLVNQSRIFAADGGNILIWSSAGDIDAGRGAKTAISAPPPVITYDENGLPTVQFGAALSGSGIRAFVTTEGRKPGDVDLFAPTGVILVNDAGIGTAGNLTIGATQVVGADNIDVGGTSIGVPVDTGGLGASLAGVSATSSSASNAAMTGESSEDRTQQQAPIAQAALSWLEVFVVGLGEENCRQDDLECLKRANSSSGTP